MIVYRTQEQTVDPLPLLANILAKLDSIRQSHFVEHERVVEVLIDFGELEAAVADALCADIDHNNRVLQEFRKVSLLLGHIFYNSWKKTEGGVENWVNRTVKSIERFINPPLPKRVGVRTPEGYAYYGLYPETYLEAAERFFREILPRRAVCIGIRSIGTGLSAIVAATLEEHGCEVHSYTLRPRGHPFDRCLLLSSQFESSLRPQSGSHFLIVDEGPGLSGTSIASVASKLSEIGVADSRIAIFPSWEPDERGFLSNSTQDRWRKHKKYTSSFEKVWIESGRFAETVPTGGEFIDLSGGKWRSILYSDESDYPPVQPQHERRKYLLLETSPLVLLKFAGLGRYGGLNFARAKQLSDAGFAPPALGLSNGFLITEFIKGKPIMSKKDIDYKFLDAMANYLSYLKQYFPSARPVPYEEIAEMIRINIAEGLGEEWSNKLSWLERFSDIICGSSTVAIDGRMLPYEWLLTEHGYLKTDGNDHHYDHFFPGCQDIAWDIAGSCVEFPLDIEEQDYLICKYRYLANDRNITERLPFYFIAYLSYRLGYTTLAGNTLGFSSDAERFKLLTGRYSTQLRHRIYGLSAGIS